MALADTLCTANNTQALMGVICHQKTWPSISSYDSNFFFPTNFSGLAALKLAFPSSANPQHDFLHVSVEFDDLLLGGQQKLRPYGFVEV